jgi:hypothetical protein
MRYLHNIESPLSPRYGEKPEMIIHEATDYKPIYCFWALVMAIPVLILLFGIISLFIS